MNETDGTRLENPARPRNQEDPDFPIVSRLTAALQASGSLKGKTIAWHCHLTLLTELAARAVVAAGAELVLSECNPATTQMEAVENLQKMGQVFLGENSAVQALASKPDILADTGFVLIPTYLSSLPHEACPDIMGASEITTSGISKLRTCSRSFGFPVFNINDGQIKSLIENFHGVGDGLLEALKLHDALAPQTQVAVVGYGKVGAGCAHYLKASGARVAVVEIDPVASLLAHFDGYGLKTLEQALESSRILVTATGKAGLLDREHFLMAADKLLIANVGHLSSEVSPQVLESLCERKVEKSNGLTEYHLKVPKPAGEKPGSRRISLLTGGNPCNVALLTGSDAPTMLHMTTEILTWDYIASHCRPGKEERLPSGITGERSLPPDVETLAARIALDALGYQFYA
ncbi:MAG: hypothetical protein HY986_14240 [Candidatus Melainabacteria bacterium]|nr:hypothetical protein [Candidatus Melainabacteria bacterium]